MIECEVGFDIGLRALHEVAGWLLALVANKLSVPTTLFGHYAKIICFKKSGYKLHNVFQYEMLRNDRISHLFLRMVNIGIGALCFPFYPT